mmetsp:Transcript_3699/g.10487  ORF Transcript_3699/g.10487 Transcript_3699/m.10487 type:complete len:102 (+) Transcript_3699:1304-1609(+)
MYYRITFNTMFHHYRRDDVGERSWLQDSILAWHSSMNKSMSFVPIIFIYFGLCSMSAQCVVAGALYSSPVDACTVLFSSFLASCSAKQEDLIQNTTRNARP